MPALSGICCTNSKCRYIPLGITGVVAQQQATGHHTLGSALTAVTATEATESAAVCSVFSVMIIRWLMTFCSTLPVWRSSFGIPNDFCPSGNCLTFSTVSAQAQSATGRFLSSEALDRLSNPPAISCLECASMMCLYFQRRKNSLWWFPLRTCVRR